VFPHYAKHLSLKIKESLIEEVFQPLIDFMPVERSFAELQEETEALDKDSGELLLHWAANVGSMVVVQHLLDT
jgi:hypothetical protein